MGKRKENFGREGPPTNPVKSRGMDSHTRLELCTTLWRYATAWHPMGGRPITYATRKSCHGKAPAPTHRDYLSHCDRGIRWSTKFFLRSTCHSNSPAETYFSTCHLFFFSHMYIAKEIFDYFFKRYNIYEINLIYYLWNLLINDKTFSI